MKKTKRLVLLAMLTAVAMILSYVESLLPSVGIPGVKMGLANIAVIFALFRFGWKEAAALSLVRVVLVSLLFGSVGAMLYSLAGAVLSLAVMALLRRIDRFSTVGISVAGGVAHNAGPSPIAVPPFPTKQPPRSDPDGDAHIADKAAPRLSAGARRLRYCRRRAHGACCGAAHPPHSGILISIR